MKRETGVTATGDTFRVQRQRADHTIRASFPTLERANAYSLAVTASWAAGAIPPSTAEFDATYVAKDARRSDAPQVPTRLDELVEAALTTHQRNKHLGDQWLVKPRGQWRKHGGFFRNPDIRNLTQARVQEFSLHLYEQRLSKPTANEYLRIVLRACDLAVGHGLVPANVASGVSGRPQDNPLQPRNRKRPRPLTPTEVKTLAAQFPRWLQLSVLLMYVACLRLSEVFGLELRDWNSVDQTLHVRRQGGLKKNEGRRHPYYVDEADGFLKTKSSRRKIPVPAALAEVIDRHIADHHGSRPEAPGLEAKWSSRRLISCPGMPKPRNTTVVDRWDEALRRIGLDFDTIGFKIDRHFLRKSGSTVIGVGNIRGKLWSGYLGHKTPSEFGGSLTTVQHYFDLPDVELVAVADRWEEVIRGSVGDLDITEEWWTTPHMTIDEAAIALGVHATQVGWLLRRGHLAEAPDEEVVAWRHQAGLHSFPNRRMVSGPSINAELDRRRRRAVQVTEAEVARDLGLSPWRVRRLRERGLLHATVEDSRWSYDPEPVRRVADLLAQERDEAHLYMGLGEAAARAGVAQHMFERLYGDRVPRRVLIDSEQVQYLRTAVAKLLEEKVGQRFGQ